MLQDVFFFGDISDSGQISDLYGAAYRPFLSTACGSDILSHISDFIEQRAVYVSEDELVDMYLNKMAPLTNLWIYDVS